MVTGLHEWRRLGDGGVKEGDLSLRVGYGEIKPSAKSQRTKILRGDSRLAHHDLTADYPTNDTGRISTFG